MNLKPEERTKAIQLASLTAVVFVVGGINIYRQLQSSSPGSSTPTTVTPASETTPNVVSNISQYAGSQSLTSQAAYSPTDTMAGRGIKTDLYSDNLPEGNGSRDPFTRIEAEPDPEATSTLRFRKNAPPIVHPAQQANSAVLPGYKTPHDTIKQPVPSPADQIQLEDFTLAGVIAGPSSSVAVIHIKDRSYQIGDGEKLPYNISLVRVTETGVYLKQGSLLLYLEIGKTLRSATPVKENALPSSSTPSSDPGSALQSSEDAPSRSEMTPEREGPMQVTVNMPSNN